MTSIPSPLVVSAAFLYAADEYVEQWVERGRYVAHVDRWLSAVALEWSTTHAATIAWVLSYWPDAEPEDLVGLVDANRAYSERAAATSQHQQSLAA